MAPKRGALADPCSPRPLGVATDACVRQRTDASHFVGNGCNWLLERLLAMSRLRRLDNSTKAALLHVADEISIHSSLRHPGCIGFESWFSDRLTGKLVLVLEYAKHGSLRHVMRQLRESEAAREQEEEDQGQRPRPVRLPGLRLDNDIGPHLY